jgi:HPt (histidine-containing phosphotransfer) domain-containing protein
VRGGEQKAIDLEVIKKMLGEAAWDIIPDMMAIFFEETPSQLAHLRQAITDNDSETVERFAHMLKGSSAITGATTLSSYCEALMMMARQGDLKEATQKLEQIEAEHKKVKETWELMQMDFY